MSSGSLVAPVFTSRYFRRNPVRIPAPPDLLGLKNASPFWLPIFDTLSLGIGPAGAVGTLGGQQSGENNVLLTIDFAWLALVASVTTDATPPVSVYESGPTFAFQMQRTWIDSNGDEQTYMFQKTPIQAENIFGANQANSAIAALDSVLPGSTPFYLKKPVLLRAGDQLQVRVQSLQSSNLILQLCLFGYIEGQ